MYLITDFSNMFKVITIEALTRKIAPFSRIQCLSTVVQTKTNERLHSFRTNEVSPLKHSTENLAQYYKLNTEVKKQLFSHGGFPKAYETQIKTFAETCIMVREPAINIMTCLNALDYEKPIVRFVMYGKKGNGKSLSLAHLIHYAFEAGFLLVHVPWVSVSNKIFI